MITKVFHLSEVQLPCPLPQNLLSAHRQREWATSRYALYKSLEELCPTLSLNQLEDFEIEHHHCLRKNRQILVGLSHSGDYGAAIVAWKEKGLGGVGIDIERSDRPISARAEKFFIRKDDDSSLKAHPLKLWMAKEAAYKALAPLDEDQYFLKDLWIRGQSFGVGKKTLGTIGFLSAPDNLSMAVAQLQEKK